MGEVQKLHPVAFSLKKNFSCGNQLQDSQERNACYCEFI